MKVEPMPTPGRPPLSHWQFLSLTIPLILAALSTPLLGAVDTAVMGRLPDPAYIGGVAVGSLIFNTLYWLLGFLRVSTSGFTAQALGAGKSGEMQMAFLRPLVLAAAFGTLFVLLQSPILSAALALIRPEADVAAHAATYFRIRIWGAPFALMGYVMVGWFMGTARVKTAVFLQVTVNLLNILLDTYFVLKLSMGTPGVAWATLIAEITGVLAGGAVLLRMPELRSRTWRWAQVLALDSFLPMLRMNRDLFIRTICLLSAYGLFTAQGAAMGKTVLAANAILFQIHYLMAYVLDGIANAATILVGKAIGGEDRSLYTRTLSLMTRWSLGASLVLALAFLLTGRPVLGLFTNLPDVLATAAPYIPWAALFPLVGFWGLQLNGVFAGATEAGPIRNSLVVAVLLYIPAIWWFTPIWQNHGLWLAFILFSLARSVALGWYLPGLNRQLWNCGDSSMQKGVS